MINITVGYALRIFGLICICFMVFAFATSHIAHAEVDTAKVAAYTKALKDMEGKCKSSPQCITEPKDLYLKMFTRKDSPETCDQAFEVFYDYYSDLLLSPRFITPTTPVFSERKKGDLAKAKAYYAKYSYAIVNGEGEYGPSEDYQFLLDTFGNVVSTLYRDCLSYLSEEDGMYKTEGAPSLADIYFRTDKPTSSELTHVAELLRQNILRGGSIIKRYQGDSICVISKRELQYRINNYFIFFEGQKVYDENKVLRPELKKSYEKFLKENTDFVYYPLVKEIYDLQEQNNFMYFAEEDAERKLYNVIEKNVWPTR